MLRKAATQLAPRELGVLPQFQNPQPLLSLSHAFRFAAPAIAPNKTSSPQNMLSEFASQYLLIESGRIPLWDKNDAMDKLKARIQDLFEQSLERYSLIMNVSEFILIICIDRNANRNEMIPLLALFKFYVTRFHNDAFPYRIMQRHYLDRGQIEQAAEMEKIAMDKIACSRSRFHAIVSCIKNSDSAANSLAKYIPTCDQSDYHLNLILQKADR